MSRVRAAVRGVFATWMFSVIAGCAGSLQRDDFPARLKGGCTSQADCRALVTEARYRMIECDRYLVGNMVARDRRHLCSYEKIDYCSALERALEWVSRTHIRPVTGGSITGPPSESRSGANVERTAKDHDLNSEAVARFVTRLSPFARHARATFPEAKRRFVANRESGAVLALMIVVQDERGFFEPAYVRVSHIEGSMIYGRLDSVIDLVRGARFGSRAEMDESNLVDWVLASRDGSVEGNILGKYLAILK
jgi:hypothetical protein